MSDQNAEHDEPGAAAENADGLLSRLKLIEDQPLETRAAAYAHVHAELRDALDAADRGRGDQQSAVDRRGDQQSAAGRQGGH